MFVFSAKRVRKKLGSKYETTTRNPKIFRLRYTSSSKEVFQSCELQFRRISYNFVNFSSLIANQANSENMLSLRRHPQKTRNRNFFFSTRRLAESVQNLNSSLAQSPGELWSCKNLKSRVKKVARAGHNFQLLNVNLVSLQTTRS